MRHPRAPNGRRDYCAHLPRREPGRPDRQYSAARKYATAKFRRDTYWHATTAPKARFFSKPTFRRVIGDMIREGLLERKRSQDPGNRRTYVARRRIPFASPAPPGQEPDNKTDPGRFKGGSQKDCAQNSPIPNEPKGNASDLPGQAARIFSTNQPNSTNRYSYPRQTRNMAFRLTYRGWADMDPKTGKTISIPPLAARHWDNCKVFFSGKGAWCFAAKGFANGLKAQDIANVYENEIQRLHRDYTDWHGDAVKRSPALAIWRGKRKLDAWNDGKTVEERYRYRRSEKAAVDAYVRNVDT